MSRYDSDLDYDEWLNGLTGGSGPLKNCRWCNAKPGQSHQTECRHYEPPEDEMQFCDRCGTAYLSTCACDQGDDR